MTTLVLPLSVGALMRLLLLALVLEAYGMYRVKHLKQHARSLVMLLVTLALVVVLVKGL